MLRRSNLAFFAVMAMLVMCAAVFAQNMPVSGTIELKKDDGTREPVVGALIEVYRVDIKAGFPSAKTDAKGKFQFAGMAVGADYAFAISAPGCAPQVFPKVQAGQENILIILAPGDGRQLTEDEARQVITISRSGKGEVEKQKEDSKKAAAENEAKRKEIEEKNKKAAKTNEIINKALKDGNDAYKDKNYDLAIAKYTEGYEADTTFIGAAPTMLNNRGIALRERGVANYNKSVAKDITPEQRVDILNKAKQDLTDSASSFSSSWDLLVNAKPGDVSDQARLNSDKSTALNGAQDTFRYAVRTKQVSTELMDIAKTMTQEFLKSDADSKRKADARLNLADLYRISQDRESAVRAYKEILETTPDSADAMAGAGLMLVDLGWVNNDKDATQEGANFLARFVSVADDKHELKEGAKQYLEILKAQNVTPQRTTTPTRRRN